MGMITENDIVDVYWCNQETTLDLKVLHVPCDVGDMWYFENAEGDIIAQNPSSSNFDTILKRNKDEK